MKLFFLYIAALQLTILLLWNSIDTFLLPTTGDIHNCLLQASKLGIFSFSELPSWLCWPHFTDHEKELWLLPLVLWLEPTLNIPSEWFECLFLPSELINIACYWPVFNLSQVTHCSNSDLWATHFLEVFIQSLHHPFAFIAFSILRASDVPTAEFGLQQPLHVRTE